jgi:peptidoglycan/xylan/chitin deacetylase (PgdA/CDA1 family)
MMIPILLYHRIADVPLHEDPKQFAVSPAAFEEQMTYLYRRNYQVLDLSEALRWWQSRQRLSRKAVVITFDDGFDDLLTTAWPILERFGFTATTFFVCGGAGQLSDWAGQTGASAARLLSWEDVRHLHRRGMSFGAHTLTHPRLSLLNDDTVTEEVCHSKHILEQQLGIAVDYFSYPHSSFDARVQRIVLESGYRAACGVDHSRWGLFNLWRAQCTGKDNLRSFALKASKYHNALYSARISAKSTYWAGRNLSAAMLGRFVTDKSIPPDNPSNPSSIKG